MSSLSSPGPTNRSTPPRAIGPLHNKPRQRISNKTTWVNQTGDSDALIAASSEETMRIGRI